MKILYAPFARRLQGNNLPSPKDIPYASPLAKVLEMEHEVVQVGGDQDEKVCQNVQLNLSFNDLGQLVNWSDTAICCDSYLQHYFWFVGKKAVVVFGISDPNIFGHKENMNLLKDRKYLRPNQFDLYYSSDFNPESFVSPAEVIQALTLL